jgi:hypothetical protein
MPEALVAPPGTHAQGNRRVHFEPVSGNMAPDVPDMLNS